MLIPEKIPKCHQFEACKLTVIGHDLVYTYYDYMITYPSEQDFAYIEELLADKGY